MPSTVEVRVEDRLRLAGVLLATGEWPAHEQKVKPYKPHRVAEHAHRYFALHSGHPAVTGAAALVGQGEGLDELYGHALNGTWPGDLGAHVASFKSAANLEAFWAETQADWDQARADGLEVMARADLRQFLLDLFGPLAPTLVLAPNLLFPGQRPIAARTPEEIIACVPPPPAWGTSPPWRYAERPDEVLAKVSETFARFLFEANLPAEHASLRPHAEAFALAAAVLFVRAAEGEAAGDQFMVMEKKTRSLKNLPAIVTALEAALADRRAGKTAGLPDYLPGMALSLRS
jgi:hypothetical protein